MLQSAKNFKISDAKVLSYVNQSDTVSCKYTYSGSAEPCDFIRKTKKQTKMWKYREIQRQNHG